MEIKTVKTVTIKFTADELEDLALAALHKRFAGCAFDICWVQNDLVLTLVDKK